MSAASVRPLPESPGFHILMIALGSAGDVHPFAALGRALRQRGHSVDFLTNPYFEDLVRRLDLNFLPRGTKEEFIRAIEDLRLWHRTEGFRLVASWMIGESTRPVYEVVQQRYRPGKTVVVGPFSAFGARLAQEKLGVPFISVHLQPSLLRSVHDAPSLPLPRFLDSWPRLGPILRRGAFAFLDRVLLEPALAPGINAFRAEIGLPAIKGILDGWIHSPEMVVGLFPDWFAAPQPDWPPNVHLTGFPLFDESGLRELPPELDHFLGEGEPPILFTAGSAMRHARELFCMVVDAFGRLGRRGILLTQYKEQLPDPLPPGVRHFDYIPLSQVLPRAAAVVHHGGVGTTAQALAAGIPQLITPFNHDQPDNAVRVTRLGAGSMIPAAAVSARKLAAQLERMLASEEMASRCHNISLRIDRGRALAEACDLIESFAERRWGRPVAASMV